MLVNTAQALEMIVGLALFAALWRMPKTTADTRPFLIAFVVFMVGTLVRELVVRFGGPATWMDHHMLWSAAARAVQITGALLYVRATFRERCGEWPWIAALVVAVLWAAAT